LDFYSRSYKGLAGYDNTLRSMRSVFLGMFRPVTIFLTSYLSLVILFLKREDLNLKKMPRFCHFFIPSMFILFYVICLDSIVSFEMDPYFHSTMFSLILHPIFNNFFFYKFEAIILLYLNKC
jgi:hypothetical protein